VLSRVDPNQDLEQMFQTTGLWYGLARELYQLYPPLLFKWKELRASILILYAGGLNPPVEQQSPAIPAKRRRVSTKASVQELSAGQMATRLRDGLKHIRSQWYKAPLVAIASL
jgi:hypothetical protein